MARIYLSPPHVEPADSNWIAPLGPHVDAFGREFAHTVGAPQAIARSSGTTAPHLSLRLRGVATGDEVLVLFADLRRHSECRAVCPGDVRRK